MKDKGKDKKKKEKKSKEPKEAHKAEITYEQIKEIF